MQKDNKKGVKWSLEEKSIKDLIPYEHNPRIIKGKPFEDLKESMSSFGLCQPLIINTDNIIIGGHARFFVAKELGYENMPCYIPNRLLNEDEVKELNIRLNKNIAGSWDFDILANYFESEDLKNWGFESHEFGKFDFGTEAEQGQLNEIGGGESKTYECPSCKFTWKPEKKKKSI